MVLTGHCLCKAVKYSIDMDAPLLVGECFVDIFLARRDALLTPGIIGYDHCDDCQRQSGSTYCSFPLNSI